MKDPVSLHLVLDEVNPDYHDGPFVFGGVLATSDRIAEASAEWRQPTVAERYRPRPRKWLRRQMESFGRFLHRHSLVPIVVFVRDTPQVRHRLELATRIPFDLESHGGGTRKLKVAQWLTTDMLVRVLATATAAIPSFPQTISGIQVAVDHGNTFDALEAVIREETAKFTGAYCRHRIKQIRRRPDVPDALYEEAATKTAWETLDVRFEKRSRLLGVADRVVGLAHRALNNDKHAIRFFRDVRYRIHRRNRALATIAVVADYTMPFSRWLQTSFIDRAPPDHRDSVDA